MDKRKKPWIVKRAWRKMVKSLAGRGACLAGKINLRTERKIIARKR
ncbi:MAG: hypothetical protein Q8O93_04235 [bacterium]|nr:hypothetical protein [bacterium]